MIRWMRSTSSISPRKNWPASTSTPPMAMSICGRCPRRSPEAERQRHRLASLY
ncbi:conserved hypothetical protein, partial [Ricinus communis]